MSKKKIIVTCVVILLLLAGAVLFALSPTGLRWWSPLLERQLSRALRAPVEVDGLVLRWPLGVELERLRVKDADMTYLDMQDVSLRISAQQLARRAVWVHHFHAQRVEYNGWPSREIHATPEEGARAGEVPDLRWVSDRVVVEELRVAQVVLGEPFVSEPMQFRVEGVYAPVPGDAGRAGWLHAEMSVWGDRVADGMTSTLRVDAALTGVTRDGWTLRAEAVATDWGRFVPEWPEDREDRLQVNVELALDEGSRLVVDAVRVRSSLAEIDGSGVLDLEASTLDARVDLTVPDLAPFSGWTHAALTGALSASLECTGPLSDLSLHAQAQSERVTFGERDVQNLRVTLDSGRIAVMTEGEIRASAVLDGVPVEGSAAYARTESTLSLKDIAATVLGARLSGDAEFDRNTGLVIGVLKLESEDFAELARYWDVDARGRVEAIVRMTVEAGSQNAELEVLAADVRTSQGAVDSLYFKAVLEDVRNEPRGSVIAHVHDVAAGDLDVHLVRLAITGDRRRVEIKLDGEGELMEPWTLASSGTLHLEGGAPQELVVHEVTLRHGALDVLLEEAVRFLREEDRYTVERLAVRVGDGRLVASGHVRAEEVHLDAELQALPLSTFGFAHVSDTQGAMEGHLRVSGHPADPSAELQVRFSGLRPANTNYWIGEPANFSVTARLDERRVHSLYMLEGLTGEPVELELDVPLSVSLYPVHVQWPPEGDVSGRLLAETDLGALARLFVLDVHRLAGILSVDLQLSGTVADPEVAGHIQVVDGAYEHERTGTILRDVDVRISGGRDQLSIDHITATDGDKGRLSLSGFLHFQPEANYPFAVSLTLDQFRLLRHDAARATGNGTVNWEGHRLASRVAGRVTVSPMELRIPERRPAALIDLDVIEVNGDEAEEVDALPEELLRHILSLDVELLFPDRVYVRGRGLDSEWGGQLHVQGTTRKPEPTGSLSVMRGRFVFFGKRLAITRGVVTLDGAFPPVPVLDVVAETRSGGITAIMRLSGDVTAPEIQLDSSPPMPEDEILARMLFGREAARISPWQALMMARAVNRLRGGGSAFDIMGGTRRMLRVDQFEVRDSEEHEGQTAVRVGKYVSDRVYVEMERDVGVEGGRAQVEVELTPTIRLETEMGTNADASLGLHWSWDY